MSDRDRARESGEIRCESGRISYRFEKEVWSVAISDIRLFGEYTTSSGPYFDDYFLVILVPGKDAQWYEASFYAEGRDEVLTVLGEVLGHPMQLGLCNSVDFKNRIIWPLDLADQPFLERIPPPRPANWWERMRELWNGEPVVHQLNPLARSLIG